MARDYYEIYKGGKRAQGRPTASQHNGRCHLCETSYGIGDRVIHLSPQVAVHPRCVYQE